MGCVIEIRASSKLECVKPPVNRLLVSIPLCVTSMLYCLSNSESTSLRAIAWNELEWLIHLGSIKLEWFASYIGS